MIVIVGVGAIGSNAALMLRNEQVGLKVVDFDRVELKNTQSQFHTKMGMSKNKALAMQQLLQGLFGVRIEAVPHKLTKDNVEAVLGDATIILDCTDNVEARNLIQGYATDTDTPCLHGAVSTDGDFGQLMWTEHFVADEEFGDGATCENGEHLPFYSRLAGHMAIETSYFLKNGKKRSFQLTPSGLTQVA